MKNEKKEEKMKKKVKLIAKITLTYFFKVKNMKYTYLANSES